MTALGQCFAFDENKSKYFIKSNSYYPHCVIMVKSNSYYPHCVIMGVVGGGGGGGGFELDKLLISHPVCKT